MTGVGLEIGRVVGSPDTPAVVDPRRFNRHTFWCGQSGSGKTYALGVVLEQLLLGTELPIVLLDPNADFVRLRQARGDAPPDASARLAELDIRTFRSGSGPGEPLRARFVDLSLESKAAVLQLDPIADAEEYNVLLKAELRAGSVDPVEIIPRLRASDDPGEVALSYRMENLRVLDWDLWSRGAPSVVDVIDARPRASILDLGGFGHPSESRVAALAVLEHLWARREERRPVLIVIDEAHNICPPDPRTDVERALTSRLVQIAAEGRKFGLWLFLSTQRPGKIHPNVLSQCDNLGLMRVNSPRDLAELADVFGFAGEEEIRRSMEFRQGQALFAGAFVNKPTFVQMGSRITEEAGGDVDVPLRHDQPGRA